MFAAALLAGSARPTAQSKTPLKSPAKPVSEATGFPTVAVWTIDIAANPVAPPVAGGDRLFLALVTGVSARRLSDHAEVWTKPIVASGPMAASRDRLAVPTKEALEVLDAATGERVWTAGPGPFTAPPRIHGDLLFAASGEKLTAYDLATGALRWTNEETGVVEQRPTVSGARVYVPAADGRLLALDLKSGKQLWVFDVGIKPTEPLVDGGRIFVGSATREFWCLSEADRSDRELWKQTTAAPVIGVPVIDDRHVYFAAFDNVLRALDRNSGNQEWKFPVKYRPSTGPLLAGGQIVVPGYTDRLDTLDARTGKAVGTLSLPLAINIVPALVVAENQPTKLATFFGNLETRKLILTEPPLPTYAPPDVTPLTAPPGRVVPLSALQIPRG